MLHLKFQGYIISTLTAIVTIIALNTNAMNVRVHVLHIAIEVHIHIIIHTVSVVA